MDEAEYKIEEIVFCENCQDDVKFEIRNEIIEIDMEDIVFSYEALVPYCKECGNEVSVPEINDLNIIRAYKAQKEALENREEFK
ncbi:MAG TPA: hypothetical protein PK604_08200 [Acetivibrio clariflavus]|nr:hypothetical protein [Acetivibrio clariflavus]